MNKKQLLMALRNADDVVCERRGRTMDCRDEGVRKVGWRRRGKGRGREKGDNGC